VIRFHLSWKRNPFDEHHYRRLGDVEKIGKKQRSKKVTKAEIDGTRGKRQNAYILF